MKYASVVIAMMSGTLLTQQQYIASFITFFFALLFAYMPSELPIEEENDV